MRKLFLLLPILLLLLGRCALAVDETVNNVAYYNLGTNGNDNSGNGHNATNNGATFGSSKASFVSASSQYIETTDLAGIDATGSTAMSYSCWLSGSGAGLFVGMGRDSNDTKIVSIVWYNDATVYVELDDGSAEAYGSFSLSGGGEHCFLVTYDGTQTGNANRLKCYCDGVQKTLSFTGTVPASIPATDSTNHWMFGKDYSARFDSGSIRCAGFWSDVKTQADATALYNGGTPPLYSDLSTLHPKSQGNFFLFFR